MNATRFLLAARHDRVVLACRWEHRFSAARVIEGDPEIKLPADLAASALDALLEAFASDFGPRASRRTLPRRFAELVDFPACVAVCMQFYQAGAQVIGTYIVENAGVSKRAAWSRAMRNQLLGELDAVFHVLTHEAIEELGRLIFDDFPRPESFHATRPKRLARRPARALEMHN
jgi:NAD(P)-dependent dehydrogenase (short-subunit alcohol dehydrogenase family)